jgi:glycosyltransferase involved in cell wall biosynthesis
MDSTPPLRNESEAILIISYVFPPMPGIGGRRWAKFSKYLVRQGVTPVVIHATNPGKRVSTYTADVADPGIIKIPFPHRYYKYILVPPAGFFEKIVSKIQYTWIKLVTRGNYYDRSLNWKSYFGKEIPEVIRKYKIRKVIVSGAPFHYFSFSLSLKKIFPSLELILDYRDPWSDFNIGYDDPRLQKGGRYQHERDMEISVLMRADKIFCVSEFQKRLLESKVPEKKLDISVIPNGYDAEDSPDRETGDSRSEDELTLVHFGTLHYLKEDYFRAFFGALARIRDEAAGIYSRIRVHFVGAIENGDAFRQLVEDYDVSGAVTIHGIIGHRQALNILKRADIALWFKFDESAGDFGTKFYEYAGQRKYIWVFTRPGEVADFVSSNRIGTVFLKDSESLPEDVRKELLAAAHSRPEFNPEFRSEQFSVGEITRRLIQVLR